MTVAALKVEIKKYFVIFRSTEPVKKIVQRIIFMSKLQLVTTLSEEKGMVSVFSVSTQNYLN